MHVIGIRTALLEQDPTLGVRVYAALVEARDMAYAELQAMAGFSTSMMMLPFYAEEFAATKALMGDNYWSYGAERNRAELETMFRYSHEQHLSQRLLTLEEVFAAGTLDLAG